MRTENLPAPAPPVKVRSAQDPEIRAEVTRLLGKLHEPDLFPGIAQELVSLREENAALRQLVDIRDEDAPIPFPEKAPAARIALLAEASGKSFTEYEEEMRGAVKFELIEWPTAAAKDRIPAIGMPLAPEATAAATYAEAPATPAPSAPPAPSEDKDDVPF